MVKHWINTTHHFGWLSILLHWSMAILLIGMYFLGDYMVGLDYYDDWYHQAPALHKAVGVLLFFLLIIRLIWKSTQVSPQALQPSHRWQNRLAQIGHWSLYGLVIVLVISGYLISTAKGQGVDVFGWFTVPALLPEEAQRGELAGDIHEIVATVFILLVLIHIAAAFKHHFFDKDKTLLRMLGIANHD
ncbi:MAG: cytochrome b [bacterium]